MNAGAISSAGAPVITSFISATSVQITTAANVQAAQTGCFIWGTPDDANAVLVEAAYDVALQCPKLMLSAAGYWFNNFHFNSQPTACGNLGAINNTQFGNLFYPVGFELEGRGVGNTAIWLGTNFPTGAVGGACTNGTVGVAAMPATQCFAIPQFGHWRDLRIDGGGNGAAATINNGAADSADLIGAIIASIDNVTVANWGNTNQFTTCFTLGYQVQLYQVNNSACGLGFRVLTGQGVVSGFKVYNENSLGNQNFISGVDIQGPPGSSGATLGYSFVCTYCGFYTILPNATGVNIVANEAGSVLLRNTQIGPMFSNATQSFGYRCRTTPGGLLILEDSQIKINHITTDSAIVDNVACTTVIRDSTLTSGATGSAYTGVSGSKFLSEGGNTLTGPVTVNAAADLLLKDSDALTGVTSGITPTCAFTSGGGTSPSCAIQAGSTNEKGVIIATTGTGAPGSSGTVTLTFVGTYSGPGATNPVCVYNVDNSGTAWGNEAGTQVSTQSTTAPIVAWFNVNSVVATALTTSSPYRISYKCEAR